MPKNIPFLLVGSACPDGRAPGKQNLAKATRDGGVGSIVTLEASQAGPRNSKTRKSVAFVKYKKFQNVNRGAEEQ